MKNGLLNVFPCCISGQEISIQSNYFPWIFPELPRTLRNYAGKICIEMSSFLYGNSPEMRKTEGKFCGKDLSMEMSLFLYGNSAEMRKIEGKFCGKNIGMNMSLFLYGHSVEMRETEGNSAGKKQRHGNEIISVWNSAEMRETEGRSYTLTFLSMLV